MEYVFAVLLAVLAALVVIIFELRKITTWMDQKTKNAPRYPEARDTPTINVNLGSLPMQESRTQNSDASEIKPKPLEDVPLPEPEQEPEPAIVGPPKFYHIPPKTTASGLGIAKCPQCGAENSAFRTECFSCGASLH